MTNCLRGLAVITAIALVACTPVANDDDGDSNSNGMADAGNTPNEGGATAGGGSMAPAGGAMAGGMDGGGMLGNGPGNFVDPDEGEPMPYQTPAGLDDATDGPPVEECGPDHYFVGTTRGWVADRIGRPLSDAMVQLCIVANGAAECLTPRDTDENGVFQMNTIEGKRCLSKMVFRSIMPGQYRAPAYIEYDVSLAAQTGGNVVIQDPFVLYATIPIPNPPQVDDDEAMHTFTFHTGMEMDLVPFDLNSNFERLGVRVVEPTERGLSFLEGEPSPDLLLALSPDSSVYGDGAAFRLPNSLGLAAGAKVDFFFVGGVGCKINRELVKEGHWVKFGTGTTSDDGSTIASDSGSGLTCVSWLGVYIQ